jgi:ABC-type dipeptide/oligopeptide/nickel transport system permease subunit
MILGETALSFLGLGPAAARDQLGRAAQRAQNINVVALYPG